MIFLKAFVLRSAARRRPIFAAVCLLLMPLVSPLLLLPSAAWAQAKDLVRADEAVTCRAALVIGNTHYEYKPLKNPANDAREMANALTQLGFKVTLKYDLTLVQMREVANAWADSLDSHTLALVYYSGHGVTGNGQNYLVPVNNGEITHKRDVAILAYPFQSLLDATKEAGCPLRIFILDACRNDPLPKGLKGDDGQTGLVKVVAPTGAFIAYAAGFGETASDNGENGNGLYTTALLKNISTPGLPIEALFKRVRAEVLQSSGGDQHPDESSQLIGDFCFTGTVSGNGSVVDTKGRLAVSVTDAKSDAPLRDPTVTVDGQPAPGGLFALNLLDELEKKVSVRVTAPGYEGKLIEVVLLRGRTVSQTVTLDALAAPVPGTNPVGKTPTSAKLLATLSEHTEKVTSVAFSPDGSRVVTAGADGTAKLWDVAAGEARRTFVHSIKNEYNLGVIDSVAFSPDGKQVATAGDGTIKLWNIAGGQPPLIVICPVVQSVAFSPDGKYFVTGDLYKNVKIWDAATGKIVRTFMGHSNYVNSAVFSLDNKRIVSTSKDETAKIWDVETGKELLTLTGHGDWVNSAAFSPDGSRVVTGSGTAKIWDATSGEVLFTLKDAIIVKSVAYSPDGRYFVTGSYNGNAIVWDAATGKKLCQFWHIGPVNSVAFSRDGRYIVTGGDNKTAKVWELQY